jgi:hypothetical protein
MARDQIYIGIGIAIGSMQYRLMNMLESCIFIGMSITLKIDDALRPMSRYWGVVLLGGTEKRRHGPS